MNRCFGGGKILFTTDYTDYHRIRILMVNNLKFTLCYSVSSVSSVVNSDTPSGDSRAFARE
ncbi:hypothetical protein DXA27_02530 [Bacteroides fragilis]|uniref:Uncharacterized protein n=1 Tax=Bacteroides fragilis TaxID=817 RepID=A0A413K5B3_BACFG|nr:hypothetical protein DXA27_02530 [Bacteroides fragilis]